MGRIGVVMNSMNTSRDSESYLSEVSADELLAVVGGVKLNTVLFDYKTATGTVFYDDGRIIAFEGGKVVARTGPNPA